MTERLIDAPARRLSRYPAQGHQPDHPTVPKAALWAAAAIMLATVLGATAARYGEVGAVRVAEPAPSVTRMVSFHADPGGALEVRAAPAAADASDGASSEGFDMVARFAPGEAGFVHGVLRAMRRDRGPQGVAETAPYALVMERNGRLILEDPSTGRRLELRGFGADHYATFRGFLNAD